jgi:hypothetical protein
MHKTRVSKAYVARRPFCELEKEQETSGVEGETWREEENSVVRERISLRN